MSISISPDAKANFWIAILYGLLTGTAFWIPDIVVHSVSGKSFSSDEMFIVTLLSPVVSLLSFYTMRKMKKFDVDCVLSIVSSIFGIWITGPFFMMVSASFSNGGFLRPGAKLFEQISQVVTLTAVFPFSTFIMSTYDGTLFAVFIASGLILFTGLLSRRHVS